MSLSRSYYQRVRARLGWLRRCYGWRAPLVWARRGFD